MTEDPIVAAVRKVRHEHAAKFNNDIAAICDDIRRQEKESGQKYVSYPPRRIEAPVKERAAKPKRRPKAKRAKA